MISGKLRLPFCAASRQVLATAIRSASIRRVPSSFGCMDLRDFVHDKGFDVPDAGDFRADAITRLQPPRRPHPGRHAARRPREDHVAWLQRSEEHTSELQSLMRISYAVFCLKKKTTQIKET